MREACCVEVKNINKMWHLTEKGILRKEQGHEVPNHTIWKQFNDKPEYYDRLASIFG